LLIPLLVRTRVRPRRRSTSRPARFSSSVWLGTRANEPTPIFRFKLLPPTLRSPLRAEVSLLFRSSHSRSEAPLTIGYICYFILSLPRAKAVDCFHNSQYTFFALTNLTAPSVDAMRTDFHGTASHRDRLQTIAIINAGKYGCGRTLTNLRVTIEAVKYCENVHPPLASMRWCQCERS